MLRLKPEPAEVPSSAGTRKNPPHTATRERRTERRRAKKPGPARGEKARQEGFAVTERFDKDQMILYGTRSVKTMTEWLLSTPGIPNEKGGQHGDGGSGKIL